MLEGKNIIITGVANDFSIAYHIAKQFTQNKARVILTYQNDRLKDKVKNLGEKLGVVDCIALDVSNDESLRELPSLVSKNFETVDSLIHSIAFTKRDLISNDFLNYLNRENFQQTLDISCYSLFALIKSLEKMLNNKSSILTLTYLGAVQVVPNYSMMGVAKAALESSVRYLASTLGPKGIRVNAISAGAIKTLAAMAIKDFGKMLEYSEQRAPLKRNVTPEEVANVAMFLSSELASGITGEITYVDCGLNITAMSDKE